MKTDQAQIEGKINTRAPKPQARSRRKRNFGRATKTVRVRLWADKELAALIDRGAKICGLSRAGFVRQAIAEKLPEIEAAMKRRRHGN